MTTINIDNSEYDFEGLSQEAKAQLQMLQATDQQIAHLNLRFAIAQTARNAYAKALKDALPKTDNEKTTT